MSTGKSLRVIVPLLQVLILIFAFSLDPLLSGRFALRSDLKVAYVVTPLNMVLKLNYPLTVLLLPVIYIIAHALEASRLTGALRVVILGGVDIVIIASVVAFWYLVVVEVEMRRRKSSCLRFSGRQIERLKAVIKILMGAGAAGYALWDGRRLMELAQINRHSLYWNSLIEALVGGLFLTGWAVVLITMGVQDLIRVSDSETSQARG